MTFNLDIIFLMRVHFYICMSIKKWNYIELCISY